MKLNRKPRSSRQRNRGGFEDIPEHQKPCPDAQHNPPNMMVIPQGKQYRHVCPTCQRELVLRANDVNYCIVGYGASPAYGG